jgi:hypothetical protein
MFESSIVVYKFVQDLHFFVTGGEDENELILATVLQGFFDAVGLLLRFPIISVIFYALFVISVVIIHLSTLLSILCFFGIAEAMWKRKRHWRTWISFYYALMKLLTAGMQYVFLCTSFFLSFSSSF